jgi:RNA polymerase sigma-70 factor (ECF subfamily)
MSRDEERALLLRCRAGEGDAYGPVVRAYEGRIFRLVRALIGDDEEARDLTQDAFVRAWRRLDRLDPERPFLPWLTAIARNLTLEALRTRRRHRRWLLPGTGERVLAESCSGEDPSRRVETAERMRQLQWALDRLSPVMREAVVLKDVLELAYEEVAAMQGVPRGTVASRVHHARRALAGLMADQSPRSISGTSAVSRPIRVRAPKRVASPLSAS